LQRHVGPVSQAQLSQPGLHFRPVSLQVQGGKVKLEHEQSSQHTSFNNLEASPLRFVGSKRASTIVAIMKPKKSNKDIFIIAFSLSNCIITINISLSLARGRQLHGSIYIEENFI